MHKRHAASEVAGLTMCGYDATPAEYEAMLRRKNRYVSCKKCAELLEQRKYFAEEDDFDAKI